MTELQKTIIKDATEAFLTSIAGVLEPVSIPTSEPLPELMTEAETAEYLQCSKSMLYKERQKGRLTCYMIGSSPRYSRTDIESYLEKIKLPAWDK